MALLSIDRALKLLLEQVTPKEEGRSRPRALGRILSAGVHAPCATHEANSAMDGYALAAGDGLVGGGRSGAGKLFDRPSVSIKQSGSLSGVLPEGTDSVLIQKITPSGRATLIDHAPIKGQHVRAAGSTCAQRPAHGGRRAAHTE